MPEEYEEFFKNMETPEPPAGLSGVILARIDKHERRLTAFKIGVSGAAFGGSVWILVLGATSFGATAAQSGFLQFGSLFFSDFGAAATNFPSTFLSLTESFPIVSAAMMLGGVFTGMWSLNVLASETSARKRSVTSS